MKSKFLYVIVCSFFMMATSCSSDDDGGVNGGSENISLKPISIEFINENGTAISSDCLDSNQNYAIRIETEETGLGAITATQIQYT